MEEIIADSMTLIMERSNRLNIKYQRAIGQEFSEWLKGGCGCDELFTITKN